MRWYELLIEASEKELESLLAEHPGDAEGPGGAIYRGSELRLAESSIADRILEFLHAKTHHLVFASEPVARELVRAIREKPDIKLEGVREVLSGRVGIKAEAYNREIGEKIHRALTVELPPGTACLDLERVEQDPEAEGVERFSPVHEYVYKAQGRIVGIPPGILELDRRLVRLDFVHEEPLELETREASEEEVG